MLRRTLAVLSLAALSGCAASGDFKPFGQSSEEATPARLAAWAARSEYPQATQPTDLRAAAIVNRDKGTVKIYNLSSQAIPEAKMWVNRAYVAKVGSIAPMSKATVSFETLYDATGRTLAEQKDKIIGQVQLQAGDNLYNLEGPAAE